MARVLVHALAATAGGGKTYLRHLLRRLAGGDSRHEWLVLVPPGDIPTAIQTSNVKFLRPASMGSELRRVLFDQVGLRRIVARERVSLILATANFGMISPPVPQVLLNRNALYFSQEHVRELRHRREYRELMRTLVRRQLALASIRSSAVNIVPTAAFGRQILESLRPGVRVSFRTLPFGFDHQGFARRSATLSEDTRRRLSDREGVRRVLLVSHYNYFRNFDTLLRAIALLKSRMGTPIELILTTQLAPGLKEHRYDTSSSARLIQELGIADVVTMLGNVSHEELPALYREADVVVCPSYAESFGHPMVEAMACGAPLVAADRGVHREICGAAALYFSTFDPEDLASQIARTLRDADGAKERTQAGRERSLSFTWDAHFAQLLGVVEETLKEPAHVAADT